MLIRKEYGHHRGKPGQQHWEKVSSSGHVAGQIDHLAETVNGDKAGKNPAERSRGTDKHRQYPNDDLSPGGDGKPEHNRHQQAKPG